MLHSQKTLWTHLALCASREKSLCFPTIRGKTHLHNWTCLIFLFFYFLTKHSASTAIYCNNVLSHTGSGTDSKWFPLMCTRALFRHRGSEWSHNMKIDVIAMLSDCFSVSDLGAMPLFIHPFLFMPFSFPLSSSVLTCSLSVYLLTLPVPPSPAPPPDWFTPISEQREGLLSATVAPSAWATELQPPRSACLCK